MPQHYLAQINGRYTMLTSSVDEVSGNVCATQLFLVFSHHRQKKSKYSHGLPYSGKSAMQRSFIAFTKIGRANKLTHAPGS